jgi:hypothetical protein
MVDITLITVIKINIPFPVLFKDYIRILFTLVEYFGISEEDHITNESYIETSKLTICNEINLSFYSKVNSSHNNINLVLFIYKNNVWKKEWEYINDDSQWKLHQLKIKMPDKNEDIRVKFI